jgi:hypothetical protein
MVTGKDKQLIYGDVHEYIVLLKKRNIHILHAYLLDGSLR